MVIVWRESAALLRRCLRALEGQRVDQFIVVRSKEAEFSDSLPSEFPNVEWIEHAGAGDLPQMQWLALPRVCSDVAAFLEAPSIPGPGWADAHRKAHIAHPEILACGGSVRIPEDAAAWQLGWYWSDYSAYAAGRPSGETRDLTDANVSYKSRLLRANESLLAENAWGWRIRTKSALMSYYEATAWIDYPCAHTLKIALQRRWSEGRAHGAVRARDALSILTAPVAPIVLAWRGWRGARRAGRRLSYVRALPWVLAFHVWWACGDLTGLLAGRRSRY